MIETNSSPYNLVKSTLASQTCNSPKPTSSSMSGLPSVEDATAAVAAQAAAATGTHYTF